MRPSDLGRLGEVTAGRAPPAEGDVGGSGALVALGKPAQEGNRLGPRDQLLERGQRLGKIAGRQLRVAEQTQAHALVIRARDLVGAGEGGLGQSDGVAGRVAGQGQRGIGLEEHDVPGACGDRRQSSGGAELVLGDVGAAGCAFGEHEREVGIDGGAGVADCLAEGECLAEPRPSEFEVATLQHDLAEKESNPRSEPRQGSECSGQHSPSSRLGLVQGADDKVELHLGDEAEGVDVGGLLETSSEALARGSAGPPRHRRGRGGTGRALGGRDAPGRCWRRASLVERLFSQREGPDRRDPCEQRRSPRCGRPSDRASGDPRPVRSRRSRRATPSA